MALSSPSELARSDALTTISTILENHEDELLKLAKEGDNLPRLHQLAKADEDEQVRTDGWAFLLKLAEKRASSCFVVKRGV